MADVYVATDGSNGGTGAIGDPWLTLTYALTQVGAGDTIHMRGGTYQEADKVTISSGGSSAANPLTIKAYDAGGGAGAETVWLDGNNQTVPTNENFAGGTNSYGTWYAANYDGLIDIRASYVVIDGINCRDSKGRGIEIYSDATTVFADRVKGHIIKNLIITNCRQSGFVAQGADDWLLQNVTVYNCCNYAPFHRPVRAGQPWNHPAAVNAKWCRGWTVSNVISHSNWGEGMIPSFETENWLIEDYTAYDCMSGLLYLHRCGPNAVVNRFVLYHSDEGTAAPSRRSVAMNINNEDPKTTETAVCDDVLVMNGLIYGCKQGISLLGGDGGTYPFTNMRFQNITIVEPKSIDPTTETPQGIRVGQQSLITGIKFQNIIISSSDANVEMVESPTRSTSQVEYSYNNFSYEPTDADGKGTGDIYSDPLLVNPTATVTAGAIDVNNYKLSTSSPGRFSGKTIADVTEDYFEDTRAAPYSMGFHQGGESGSGGGDPDPGGSPTGDLEFGIARATAPTSTGTTTLTDANMTLTPKAALIISNKASDITSGEATYAAGTISLGFYDGTNQAVITARSRDAVTTTDNRNRGATDMAIMQLVDNTIAVDGELSATGFSTGAVSLSAGTAPGTAINAMAMLFAGDDFEADVTTHSFASGDTTKTVTGMAGQPNLFFAISNETSLADSTAANAHFLYGVATGATTKYAFTFYSNNNKSAANVAAKLSSGGIIDSYVDNQTYNVTPTSDGYTLTRTGDNGVRDIAVMACRITNADVSLSVEDMPTATGTDTYSVGFESAIGFILSTLVQGINTNYTNSDANGFGFGLFTENDEHSMAFVDEDAATTTDTESVYSANSLVLRQDVGTDAYKAAWSAFTSTGVTLNYASVLGTARKMVLLAIEKVVNASISVDFTADATTGTVPKTINFSATATPTNTTVTTHAWTFGDGDTATTEDPSHTYTTAGTYSVTYTASDGVVSGSKTRTDYITLTDPAPTPPSLGSVSGGASVVTTTELAIRGGGIEVS